MFLADMLLIRASQKAAFESAVEQSFAERMRVHLQELFPEECEALGQPGLRALIQHGLWRAPHHGAVSEYETCLYLHVMVVLGREFDEQEAYARERALLDARPLGSPSRIVALHERVFGAEDVDDGETDAACGH